MLRDLSTAEYISHFAAGERNLLGQIYVSVQRSRDVVNLPVPRCWVLRVELLRRFPLPRAGVRAVDGRDG